MRELLAYEAGIDAAGSNDIYDLYLVYIGDNEVQLLIYMKLLFTFAGIADGAGGTTSWTAQESADFVQTWKNNVATAWTAKRYAKYKDIYISIHVSLETKIGSSFPGSHWQIRVEKLPASQTFRTSYVWRDQIGGKYDVMLDNLDHEKKTGIGDGTQTASVHEFGHMLGLGDEYTPDAAAALQSDTKSIMNSGSTVRPRHYASVLQWAGKKLAGVMDKIDKINKRPIMYDKNMRAPVGGGGLYG